MFGINLDYFTKYTDTKTAVENIKKAGFAYLDYTPNLADDNWETMMKEDKKIFDDIGLTVHQTHAPYYIFYTEEEHRKLMDRCMEATSFLGAKYVAVHGNRFEREKYTYSPEIALPYNTEYFTPFVQEAEKRGFKLAFENLFGDEGSGPQFCSFADELLALIKSFNSKSAVCCWDFGHANITMRETQAEDLLKLGSLVECTHIHDNPWTDSHQLPMTGDIKWDEMMASMKKIGYHGVWSIEYSHGHIPDELLLDYLTFTKKTVEHLYALCHR